MLSGTGADDGSRMCRIGIRVASAKRMGVEKCDALRRCTGVKELRLLARNEYILVVHVVAN